MSASEMQRLMRDVQNNSELKSRIEGLPDVDARVAAAVSAGYGIDKSDIPSANKAVSDSELDSVSGGLHTVEFW